ncbi:purine-nucleoside phosphorylase [Undibacterium oligocarboniphilum]|uniref:Purine nucleoside phosphorylase DeoD-type n=1 Tax=Undibacterium oligocarboniphilum TaxID=666702 RepID=A0A850QEJ8_9BURK|nr:purine-nucleoside phosphorylase [Undibacterium oligocarboniphilum]MBC3870002.1 purine-nucleoside phosphorylase [Undibacterium oligocarboniphilum]NVO77619.1 purine-nucleoside phosphorylase [Undibacterium oligocarboniphilum]
MATPHIAASPGDFSDIVLMPGDPLRARMIADNWLEQAKLVTDIRNMYGYTGYYRGRRISVMAHGMGIPSLSIYATELIREYGARTLIRVGSCGAIAPHLQLQDIVIAQGAGTDSKVNRMRFLGHDFAAIADYALLAQACDTARRLNYPVHVGNVFSADLFYSAQPEMLEKMEKMRILAVEMEAAGLYGLAAEYGASALTLLTVADQIRTGASLTAAERQDSFGRMMEIALTAVLGI